MYHEINSGYDMYDKQIMLLLKAQAGKLYVMLVLRAYGLRHHVGIIT